MSSLAAIMIVADAAPLAGRLVFAAVFLVLIIWLLFMPKSLLGESQESAAKPLWKQIRSWAVVIAAMQLLIYLFWR